MIAGGFLPLPFEPSSSLTLGAELELQLLESGSNNLSSSSPKVLQLLGSTDSVKAELYQSMIEITTGICQNAQQIGGDFREALAKLYTVCSKLNLSLASAGTHPYAQYENEILYPDARYRRLLKKNQWLTRRLLIFGLHIHVGMRSGQHSIQVANSLLHYTPLLLSLSASSPFCRSEDTQLASARTSFFEAIPTAGQPCTFECWSDFLTMYEKLKQSHAIDGPKDLWWDIRPNPSLGTIEIRVCDSPATIQETEAIVALVHLLCQKIDQNLALKGDSYPPPFWLLRENKWRAMNKGIDADLIVDTAGETKKMAEYLDKVLKDLSPLIEVNDYAPQMETLRQIMAKGSSADRQRSIYRQSSKNFHPVMDALIDELRTDKPKWIESKTKKPNTQKGGSECA